MNLCNARPVSDIDEPDEDLEPEMVSLPERVEHALNAVRDLCEQEMLEPEVRRDLTSVLMELSGVSTVFRNARTPMHVSDREWQEAIMVLSQAIIVLADACDVFREKALAVT
jgi:hypothetical protein